MTLDEILDAIETLEAVSIGVRTAGRSPGRPSRPAQRGGRARSRSAWTRRARRPRVMRVLVAEAIAAEGLEALRARHEVDVRIGLSARRAARDRRRLRRAARAQPGPGRRRADRGRHRGCRSSAGPASASTTSTSTRPPVPASSSSTRRPGTRSPPRSTRSRCSTALARRDRRPADASRPPRRVEARASSRASQLRGRTLGIVGLGKIGLAIAERARGVGDDAARQRPIRDRRAGRAPRRGAGRARRAAARGRTRSRSTCPLTRATTRADRREGDRAHEAAARSCSTSRAAGSSTSRRSRRRCARAASAAPAIDVFEHEPPTGSPLLDAPNTVLTPHLGASTAEAQVAVAEEIAEQVLDVLAGRPARTRSTLPSSPPSGRRRSGRTCRSRRRSAGSSPSSRAPASARSPSSWPATSPRTTPRRSPPPRSAACSRPARPSGSTSSTRRSLAKARGHHGRRAQDRRRRRVRARDHAVTAGSAAARVDRRRDASPAARCGSSASTTTGSTWPRADLHAHHPAPRPARARSGGSGSSSARPT